MHDFTNIFNPTSPISIIRHANHIQEPPCDLQNENECIEFETSYIQCLSASSTKVGGRRQGRSLRISAAALKSPPAC